MRMPGEQRWELCRKILLHPLRGDWSAMFNIVCSSGPPSRVRRENSGNKSLAFAREKNDPQCQFFFFLSVGRRAEFNVFLSRSILLQCFAVRPGRLESR